MIKKMAIILGLTLIFSATLSAAKTRRIVGEIVQVPRLVFKEKDPSTVRVRSDVDWQIENLYVEVSEQGMVNASFDALLTRGLLSTRAQISFKDEGGKTIDTIVTPYETLYSNGSQGVAHSAHSTLLRDSFAKIAYIEVIFL